MNSNTKKLSEVNILGVPIDNLTLESAIERILAMIESYKVDGFPRLVATVNVDFLMNSLNWRPNKPARHPELLEILRKADLVTADGMPVVWLSRLLNSPLDERVTGADLVPGLAKVLAATDYSIFFLGGKGDVGQRAANKLQSEYEGLTIAGVYSPFVHTEGEKMLSTEAQDDEILKRINAANPDILLVGFGNPKQELWFNRNRHKLKAAVTIGIGGTYEFITGSVNRAPLWVQNIGMEWVYRIFQDPGRLWKRYALGLGKLAILALPVLVVDRLQRSKKQNMDKQTESQDLLAGNANDNTVAEMYVKFARRLDGTSLESLDDNWLQQFGHSDEVIFDFSQVEFMDSTALGKIVRLYKRLQTQHAKVISRGITNKNIIRLLKVSHVWDLLNEHTEDSDNIQENNKQEENGMVQDDFIRIQEQTEQLTVASLHGRLDASQVANTDFDQVLQKLGQRHYLLDLSELKFLDSTGLRFFFNLLRTAREENRKMILMHPNDLVRQVFNITKLDEFFIICDSEAEARTMLSENN